jgi:hypothetical protein
VTQCYNLSRIPGRTLHLTNRITGADAGTAETHGGWEWTYTTEYGDQRSVHTDSAGDGLWMWLDGRAEWQQQTGTCQFHLPASRPTTLRILRRIGMMPDRLA